MTWWAFEVFHDPETGANHSERAHNALEQYQIRSIFPHHVVEKKRRIRLSNRRHTVRIERVAILPGYAFARHEDGNDDYWLAQVANIRHWHNEARKSYHKVRLYPLGPIVGDGQAALDRLMARSGSKPELPWKPSVGHRVIIHSGPAVQAEPVVIEALTKNRARVTLGTLPVWVLLDQLEAA